MSRSRLARILNSIIQDEEGTTAVEYAVMLALIIAVCIGAVGQMSVATEQSFADTATAIIGAPN